MFSKVVASFFILPSNVPKFQFLYALTLDKVRFLNFRHFNRYAGESYIVLNSHFPNH